MWKKQKFSLIYKYLEADIGPLHVKLYIESIYDINSIQIKSQVFKV